MPDFIGGDPESNASECPAVFVIPETGDFVFRGKTITDPAPITELNQHIGKAEDESDVWLPARMAPLIRDALEGYEQGEHTFASCCRTQLVNPLRDARLLRRDEQGSRMAGTGTPATTGATPISARAPPRPCRTTCGGSTPAPRSTSRRGRISAGCPAPKPPT